ncbi:MAG TPA: hypothetical protein VN900_11620 [Stellaceae bacterium]|jgi:predicted DNA-binding protein with PD1-like motif|nr:hypothetical protein [Stellaceae bacterium]
MKSKLIAESAGTRTFVLILDPGKKALVTITRVAAQEGLSAASFTALGASNGPSAPAPEHYPKQAG